MSKTKGSMITVDESWEELNSFLRVNSYTKYFVLVDENTAMHCLPLLDAQLKTMATDYHTIKIAPGEASKTMSSCEHIWKVLTQEIADRQALLINLGGGMITDLGGFAAATYKRGIDFLNVPTSLLAMVDASVGGKCGLDFMDYKNQIGVFQEAKKSMINLIFLKTLVDHELRSGFAEMLKHGLIADAEHYNRLLEVHVFPSDISATLLQRSIEIKKEIVEKDPLEKGERKKLNFGHTIGHALESYFLQRKESIPHGYAVAAGIWCESYISCQILGLSAEEQGSIENQLNKYFSLPFIEKEAIEEIMNYISQDKKNEGSKSRFTLIEKIGSSSINHEVGKELIKKSLDYYCNRI